MSNLVDHAESELKILGMLSNDPKADPMDRLMGKQVLNIVKIFSEQGHSGFSAGYAASLVEKLLRFEPISDLTGEDSEWNDVSTPSGRPMFQNNRSSRVFKEGDQAYDIYGKVFKDKDGTSWTNGKSRVKVKFPYQPKTKYIKRRWWKFWL